MEKSFDLDSIMSEITNRIEEVVESTVGDHIENALADAIDNIEDNVTGTVQNILSEALSESLSSFEFVLNDGTILRPKQYMKLLSPDKTKLLLCYGGLRVDEKTLLVQTRSSCWEMITCYESTEDAIEALDKVKKAMDAGLPSFEL